MEVETLKTKTDLSLKEINILLDQETNIKTFQKIQYFRFKKMGYTKIEACKLAGLNESSRYYLDDLWEKGGYNALIPHYNGGRKSKLSNEDMETLEKILKSKDSWLIKDVIELIEEKFNVKYGYHNVRKILIKFNIPISNHFEIEKQNKNDLLGDVNNLSEEARDEITKISSRIKDEKSTFVLKKLSYLLLRYLGYSNKQASEMYNISTVTGNTWLKAWKQEGYEGLKRKSGQGRKKKLTSEQEMDLKKTR